MSAREWSDDTPRSGWAKVRCVRVVSAGTDDDPQETGCGWTGTVRYVQSYGTYDLEHEACEDCGGPIDFA